MNISMLIGGAETAAQGNRTFERCDPLTGECATVAPAASIADAQNAAKAAGMAYPAWSRTGPAERRKLLLKAADELEAMTPDIIQRATAETGSTGP